MDYKTEKSRLRKQVLRARDAILPEQKAIWDRQIAKRLKHYDGENPCAVYLCYVNYKSEVSTREFIEWCLKRGKTVFVPGVQTDPLTKKTEGRFQERGLSKAEADNSARREMEFYKIASLSELKAGYHGILEPPLLKENAFPAWIAGREGVRVRILLPGTVFDKKGNRIGYGGGFYDRWFAKRESQADLEAIGLAYSMQVCGTDAFPDRKSRGVSPRGDSRAGEALPCADHRQTGKGALPQENRLEIPAKPHDRKADGIVTERGFIWI